jgi:hypothetical protein
VPIIQNSCEITEPCLSFKEDGEDDIGIYNGVMIPKRRETRTDLTMNYGMSVSLLEKARFFTRISIPFQGYIVCL